MPDEDKTFSGSLVLMTSRAHTHFHVTIKNVGKAILSLFPKARVSEMARGGDVPKLGGYDYEFTSTVPEDWQCPVCRLTLKDPVQIVGCGHRLCTICMESLMR